MAKSIVKIVVDKQGNLVFQHINKKTKKVIDDMVIYGLKVDDDLHIDISPKVLKNRVISF